MSPARQPTNLPASVRARLLALSRQRNVEFQLVLAEFAIERLLYRLGASSYAGQFVLKGAMLFKLWSAGDKRATWDLDLLGRGASEVPAVEAVIGELCSMRAEDGIVFDRESIAGEEIRAADEYAGVRVRLRARLGDVRIQVQVDVGFGDAILPAPTWQNYPTLLGQEAPRVLAYPREAVIAEKCEAMVSIGVTNSRMKDFYDVHLLASSFAFEGDALAQATRATFERRGTALPEGMPLVLTRGFLAAPEREVHWRALLQRGRLSAPPDVEELAGVLRSFLGPVLVAAARDGAFRANWPAGGPWRMQESSAG